MAFRFVGRQMSAGAGRALLGAPRQLREYCQKASSTETSSTKTYSKFGRDVRTFIGGGVMGSGAYMYWLDNEAGKVQESRTKRWS